MADRSEERAEIMDAAEENAADENPERDRQSSEHGSPDRSRNRACTCNRGEMVPHEHRSFSGDIVNPVFHCMSRCRDISLTHAPLFHQPAAVENIAAEENSETNREQYKRIQ